MSSSNSLYGQSTVHIRSQFKASNQAAPLHCQGCRVVEADIHLWNNIYVYYEIMNRGYAGGWYK